VALSRHRTQLRRWRRSQPGAVLRSRRATPY